MQNRMFRKSLVLGIMMLFVMTGLIPNTVRDASASEEELVGYWSFDEGSGSVAYDGSGYGNHGAIHGATWATGISGYALELDGVDDYVEVFDSPGLNPTNAITLEAWYKPTISWSGHGNDPVIDKGYGAYKEPYFQYHLGVRGDQYPGVVTPLDFEFDVAAGGVWNWLNCGTSHSWSFGNWYHLVGTCDGSTMKLYVNGNLIDSKSVSGTITNYEKSVYFGKHTNPHADVYLPGLIDEIRIYSRALTASEILNHYNNPGSGLVAHWKFDEGSGSTAYDSSGNDIHGTIYGATWTNGISEDALSFDGVNDYIDFGSSTLNNVPYLSIEFWMKYRTNEGASDDETNPTNYILAKQTGTGYNRNYCLTLGSQEIYFGFCDGTSSYSWISSGQLIANSWYHVVVTRDGSYARIYIDGELVGSVPYTFAPTTNSNPLFIGSGNGDAGRYFDGLIDEFRIYNCALTASEIEEHYNEFYEEDESPELASPPIIENLFYFDTSDVFQSLSGILEHTLYGTYIWVRITCSVTNPETIDQVKCKFRLSGGIPSEITDEMNEIEPGKYVLEKKFVNVPDLVLRLLHSCITTPSSSSPPPTYVPDVYLDEIIIIDTKGIDHSYSEYMPVQLPTFCGLICGYETLVVTAYSPVDLLVTSPSGKIVGAYYEDGNYAYEISEISSALYTGHETEPEMIIIISPEEGNYTTDVYGTGDGKYNLSMIYLSDDEISEQKDYSNIPVTTGKESNYTIKISIEDLEDITDAPGFEIISVIIAIAAIIFWNRYKKK